MIEPEYATRFGFSARFAPNAKDDVESAIARVQALGVSQFRLELESEDDPAWMSWQIKSCAVLPNLLVSIGGSYKEAFLADLLTDHADCFTTVELVDNENFGSGSTNLRLGAAVSLADRLGRVVVIGVDGATAIQRLIAVHGPGIFKNVSAIGLHQLEQRSKQSSLSAQILELGREIEKHARGIPIWLTKVGFSTWKHDANGQLQTFIDALLSPAGQVYWHTLNDDSAADFADKAAHFGIDFGDERPKLLGRLLFSGINEVQSVLILAQKRVAPAIIRSRPVLVTGGAGFIGANLSDRLAANGHDVVVYDALARPGVERNLRWLARRHPKRVSFALGDLRDETALREAAAQSAAIFHLAGQVAVTTSMLHPLTDFEVNARGTIALLEAVRQNNRECPVIFASTNKVYGDLQDIDLMQEGECYLPISQEIRARGVNESRPLCFHTPYGCSKGTADQYVLDYAHSFGLHTAVLRMSCIYGERQFGTEDQGWVAHFLLRAIAGDGVVIYGDGRQVRDILHVGDAVSAYLAAWANIGKIAGRAYNLGGGPENAVSLLQLIGHIESLLGRLIDVEFASWRPGDQRYFVSDTTAIRRDLALQQALAWRLGVARLAEHFGVTLNNRASLAAAVS